MRNEKGFSLAEMTVVLAIIGIILCIGLPLFMEYKRGTCDQNARQDLSGLPAAWEKFIGDGSNQYSVPPTDLTDLAGLYYGWGGTSGACDVRAYYDANRNMVYTASWHGSRPYGTNTRYMYIALMPRAGDKRTSKVEPKPGILKSMAEWFAGLFEPGPAFAQSQTGATVTVGVGIVKTSDLDNWKSYPAGVGRSQSAFDEEGKYISSP